VEIGAWCGQNADPSGESGFIPRFLLNRFASRSSGSKRWIWQVDRNGRIKELSTKDAAVDSYFYDNPTTGVEDEFPVAEGDYHRTLQYIDPGADPNSKTTDLNRFMWSLVIRTRSLRENTANTFEHMLNESIENMKTNEAREFLRRHLAENLDNYVLEKLEEPQRTVARVMLMDPHARHFMEQFIEKEINKFDLNLFMKFFKQKFEEE
jgi:hypothetical protein